MPLLLALPLLVAGCAAPPPGDASESLLVVAVSGAIRGVDEQGRLFPSWICDYSIPFHVEFTAEAIALSPHSPYGPAMLRGARAIVLTNVSFIDPADLCGPIARIVAVPEEFEEGSIALQRSGFDFFGRFLVRGNAIHLWDWTNFPPDAPVVLRPGEQVVISINQTHTCVTVCGSDSHVITYTGEIVVRNLGSWPEAGIRSAEGPWIDPWS